MQRIHRLFLPSQRKTPRTTGTGCSSRATHSVPTLPATAITKADSKALGKIPVLSAPSFPANVTWELYDPQVGNRYLATKTEGGTSTLYLGIRKGLVVIVR